MGRLFLLFTLLPMLELYLLVRIGSRIGFWPTLGMVVLTGVLGASLAKYEGLRVVREWQGSLARGELPTEGVLGGVLVLVGGVLLVTPGVVTDVMGLVLLFPPTRRAVAAVVRRHLERQIEEGRVRVVRFETPGHRGAPRGPVGRRVEPPPPGVIDVEGEEIDRR